jgi:hypothetical protein
MLKLETEMEKVLYEGRVIMMKERDKACEELEKYKAKVKLESAFNVYMYNEILGDDPPFVHPTHNATMLISKNGYTMRLDPDEIQQVVKCAGGNFKR